MVKSKYLGGENIEAQRERINSSYDEEET